MKKLLYSVSYGHKGKIDENAESFCGELCSENKIHSLQELPSVGGEAITP